MSLPAGVFLDRFGPRAAVMLSSVIEIAGLVLLGLGDSKTFNSFIPGTVHSNFDIVLGQFSRIHQR